jgi:hypothetical protein
MLTPVTEADELRMDQIAVSIVRAVRVMGVGVWRTADRVLL